MNECSTFSFDKTIARTIFFFFFFFFEDKHQECKMTKSKTTKIREGKKTFLFRNFIVNVIANKK